MTSRYSFELFAYWTVFVLLMVSSYSHVGATIDLFDEKSLGELNKPTNSLDHLGRTRYGQQSR